MGGKHLKKLRAEKTKIKLKAKKLLPKGQNITDTTFKVKKIVTVEQLKNVDENEPVSSWNVPLKDLLIRLNHYNYTSRLNGLTGIGELISNYSEVLKGPSLQLIVTRVLELLSDVEHKIRVTAIGLLSNLFSKLPSNSITPFFEILNVRLCCAMTHRDVRIQQDSLKLIDVVILYAPEAVKLNFCTLIQNFTRILKGYKYGSHSEMLLTKGSKQNLEKSRTDMFLRCYQILSIVYSDLEDGEKFNDKIISVSSSKGAYYLRDLKSDYKKIPKTFLFKKAKTKETSLNNFDSAEFQAQCSDIIPILFDTWTEFAPNRQCNGSSECILSEGVGQLLDVILKILLLLTQKIIAVKDPQLESWFISTYSSIFQRSFMSNFPYLPPSRKSDFTMNEEMTPTNTVPYTVQNLTLCYLCYFFKIKFKSSEHETKVEHFISSVLSKNSSESEILSKVVEAMIHRYRNKKSETCLTAIVKGYNVTKNANLRRRLLKILTKLVMEDRNFVDQRNQVLMEWMKTLPHKLLKSRVSLPVLESILKIIKTPAGSELLREVENSAVEIINNLPYIKIEGIESFEGQKLIISILYWCSNHVLDDIMKEGIFQKDSYPPELRSYITNVFSYKLSLQCCN